MDVELQDGDTYLIWFNSDDGGDDDYASEWIWAVGNYKKSENRIQCYQGAPRPQECEQIIPLVVATQAPALQAEVARLRAACSQMSRALKEMYAAWDSYEMLAALDSDIQTRVKAALDAAEGSKDNG